MKLNRILVLAGLLIGVAPGVSYAGCAASCVNCRYEAAGNYFYCGDAVKGVRPRAVGSVQAAGGGAVPQGTTAGVTAKSTAPKQPKCSAQTSLGRENSVECVQSPRDVATGQVKGKGASSGVADAGQEKQTSIKKP